jgi:NAD(P)-dependent dehydrogenase (short-subunit alcohol dehydrogenase family)
MGRLSGKRAIVTGAANGQGRAVSAAFVAEGAKVLAVDIEADAVAAVASEIGAVAQVCDVADETQVQAAVAAAVHEFGGVDVLYNNAGVYLRDRGDGPAHEIETELWQKVFAINTLGPFLFCKYALPHMIEQGSGSIVNVSSIGGVIASDCHAYSAAKGAVNALTRSLAHTYGRHGIRANALAAGVVDTRMATPVTQASPTARDRYRESTPLGRWATAEEIVGTAVYLASDESAYVTGVTLPVDGGLSIR